VLQERQASQPAILRAGRVRHADQEKPGQAPTSIKVGSDLRPSQPERPPGRGPERLICAHRPEACPRDAERGTTGRAPSLRQAVQGNRSTERATRTTTAEERQQGAHDNAGRRLRAHRTAGSEPAFCRLGRGLSLTMPHHRDHEQLGSHGDRGPHPSLRDPESSSVVARQSIPTRGSGLETSSDQDFSSERRESNPRSQPGKGPSRLSLTSTCACSGRSEALSA
jgi:hypothetical protein